MKQFAAVVFIFVGMFVAGGVAGYIARDIYEDAHCPCGESCQCESCCCKGE